MCLLLLRLICGDPRQVVACAHEQRPRGGDPRLRGRARRPRSWLRRRGGRRAGRAHRGGNRQTDRRAARAVRRRPGLPGLLVWLRVLVQPRRECWLAGIGRWPGCRRWLTGPGPGVSGIPGAGRVPGVSGLHGSHAAARVPDGAAAGPAVFGRAAERDDDGHRARVHGPRRRGHGRSSRTTIIPAGRRSWSCSSGSPSRSSTSPTRGAPDRHFGSERCSRGSPTGRGGRLLLALRPGLSGLAGS